MDCSTKNAGKAWWSEYAAKVMLKKKSVLDFIFKIKWAYASKTWLFLGGVFCWFFGGFTFCFVCGFCVVFFKERLICIKNFIKTSLKKHFYFCLCYHCSLINFAVDLNGVACLPLFCSSTEEKEKKLKIPQEVFPYQRQNNFWESNFTCVTTVKWKCILKSFVP